MLPAVSSAEGPATLYYEAYFAGLKVGTATVVVERDSTSYSIRGEAAVQGVAHLLSDWHSKFHAEGRFVDGGARLVEYGYQESERKKQRILKLRDGYLEVTRNGKQRPRREALASMDVLTGFFIEPACWPSKQLQTGRHNYLLTGRRSGAAGGCEFLIEHDDGDTDRVHVLFKLSGDVLIPARLTTRGLIRGRIILRSTGNEAG